jgi:hypothetical protein
MYNLEITNCGMIWSSLFIICASVDSMAHVVCEQRRNALRLCDVDKGVAVWRSQSPCHEVHRVEAVPCDILAMGGGCLLQNSCQ